jgi:hypothetical protein
MHFPTCDFQYFSPIPDHMQVCLQVPVLLSFNQVTFQTEAQRQAVSPTNISTSISASSPLISQHLSILLFRLRPESTASSA